jgi:Bacterial Ig domain
VARILGSRARFGALSVVVVAVGVVTAVASADPVTDATATLKDETSGSTTWSNSVNVDVTVSMFHCPPGGDEDAVDVYLRNTSSSGPWTLVHDGAWPTGSCSTSNLGPATFDWTVPSGDGSKTVFVRFTHGNDHVVVSDSISLDTQAPTITDDGVQSGTVGLNGWYTSAVVNGFSASDELGGSGLDAACASAFPANISSGTDEGNAVIIPSGSCTDVAGNTNNGINAGPFMIDLSDPSVAITSPLTGASTSDPSITVAGTASDNVSGLASVKLTVNGSPLAGDATLGTGPDTGTWSQNNVALQCGLNTIKATAKDNAGRTSDSAQISVTRNCVTYQFTGFYSPVDPENIAKAGQGIPLKWNLYNGPVSAANEITSTNGFSLSSTKIPCSEVGTGDAVPVADDAGSSSLRYDYFIAPTATANGQYVFVWKTLKDWANTCRTFKVTYNNVTLTADFRFTR